MGNTIEGTARLITEIACSYGFSSIEAWRWIKQGESPAVATLRADGRRYVARLFDDEAGRPRAYYISALVHQLGSAGVDVEDVVSTASGEPFARLSAGPTLLSRFYLDPPVPIPFDADDARAWGRYVARIHAACRDWHLLTQFASPWLHPDPATVFSRALALAGPRQVPRGILEGGSERIIGCWEGAHAIQPVHGDLWPGNLLRGVHGLRAIDFAEAGDGPRTIDMATAFRWMPWRMNPAEAPRLWDSWLAGYGEVGSISPSELESVPAVACLQQLIWMLVEVGASTGTADSSWYVADSSGLQVLRCRVSSRRHSRHPFSYHRRGCRNGRATGHPASES